MNVHDFSEKAMNGKEIALSDYKGKVLLIVNTASKCGLTPQLEGLEAMYKNWVEIILKFSVSHVTSFYVKTLVVMRKF